MQQLIPPIRERHPRCDVRSGAVDRFEDRMVVAQIGAGHDAEAAHQVSGQVRDGVAVQIRRQRHVDALREHDELHAGVVHDRPVVPNLGKLRGHLAAALEKQAAARFHDVGPSPLLASHRRYYRS